MVTPKSTATPNVDTPVNGAKIRKLRKFRGLSQQQLADTGLVSRSYISEIERGAKSPRLKVAQAIADVLNVELDEIRLKS